MIRLFRALWNRREIRTQKDILKEAMENQEQLNLCDVTKSYTKKQIIGLMRMQSKTVTELTERIEALGGKTV